MVGTVIAAIASGSIRPAMVYSISKEMIVERKKTRGDVAVRFRPVTRFVLKYVGIIALNEKRPSVRKIALVPGSGL